MCSESENPEGKYATLSYRWNPSVRLRLFGSNIDSFCDQIPAESLPIVLRSAVDITRKLGIRYLWVDSVCIIQDSVLDWQQQSAEMGKIYRKAWINLSAAGASDAAEDGLFFARNPEAARPIQVRLKSTNGDVERHYLLRHTFWEEQFRNSAIFERGWIFQERLLSRRVLHFGREQILWECPEKICCESFPQGLHPVLEERTNFATNPSYASWRRGDLGLSLKYHKLNAKNDGGTPGETDINYWNMRIWQAITKGYSRCDLTMYQDKLVALSGIAKDMSKLFKDDYLAGNWRSHLPEVLMWTGSGIRHRPLRTPTWSWLRLMARYSGKDRHIVRWC